ncbi:hypothetical protein ACFXJJ_22850, partial [Streptomyces sp. NPDC059233]
MRRPHVRGRRQDGEVDARAHRPERTGRMSAATAGARETGLRVEEVLDRLAASGDREAAAAAEELVRGLM